MKNNIIRLCLFRHSFAGLQPIPYSQRCAVCGGGLKTGGGSAGTSGHAQGTSVWASNTDSFAREGGAPADPPAVLW